LILKGKIQNSLKKYGRRTYNFIISRKWTAVKLRLRKEEQYSTLARMVSTSAFSTLLSTAASLYFWFISERRFSKDEFSTLSWDTCSKTLKILERSFADTSITCTFKPNDIFCSICSKMRKNELFPSVLSPQTSKGIKEISPRL
jgi:hypothetical protein